MARARAEGGGTKGRSKRLGAVRGENYNFDDILGVAKVTKEFQVYLNHSSELAKAQMLR